MFQHILLLYDETQQLQQGWILFHDMAVLLVRTCSRTACWFQLWRHVCSTLEQVRLFYFEKVRLFCVGVDR